MSGLRKPFAGLAAFLAGTYLLLAVFSVTCALKHDEPQSSSHHHGSAVSHSGFCAWACQANPTSDAGPASLMLHPVLAAAPFVQNGYVVSARSSGFLVASRAPPAHL